METPRGYLTLARKRGKRRFSFFGVVFKARARRPFRFEKRPENGSRAGDDDYGKTQSRGRDFLDAVFEANWRGRLIAPLEPVFLKTQARP
jgi:hypothetical protein